MVTHTSSWGNYLMCFQVCWAVLLLHLPRGKVWSCCLLSAPLCTSKEFLRALNTCLWEVKNFGLHKQFIFYYYSLPNHQLHSLFYYYKVLCSLCKYVLFSNSNLDLWLCFPREEESLFWESIYPLSEESPKA